MLIVVALLAVIAVMPAIVLNGVDGQIPATTNDVDWSAAYEAAEAGLEDYLQQLDANETFAQWSNANPTFACTDYEAFCSWQAVSTDTAGVSEWYESAEPTTGAGGITLVVSGKGGSSTRSVVRTFKYTIVPQSSVLDDIYWTNYEYVDPALDTACNPAGYYQNANTPNNGCWIWFGGGDVVDGDIFTNDTIHVYVGNAGGGCDAATFNGKVSSAAQGDPGTYDVVSYNNGCTDAPSGSGWPPVDGPSEALPGTSVDETIAKDVGCYISGPGSTETAVTLTLTQEPVPPAVAGPPYTTKVTWAETAGAPNAPSVQNVGANPNTCTSGFLMSNLKAALLYVNGNITINGGSTDGGFNTIVAGDDKPVGVVDETGGDEKDASLAGDIIIDGNLQYPAADIESALVCGTATPCDPYDALGLVSAHFVKVPRGEGSISIDAAILATDGSFYVEDWNAAPHEGTLSVFGAIGQDFRGPVGDSGGDGYTKDYVYDSALQTEWPPYYLSADSATWAPISYEECTLGSADAALAAPQC